MEWSSAFEALNELQKLHEGKSARLSIAEITSAVINLQDAQRNLPPQQFEDVYALFNTFQLAKRRFELPSMAEYYIYAVAIVKKFDRIAPYELYSGGETAEFSLLMGELRKSDTSYEESALETMRLLSML